MEHFYGHDTPVKVLEIKGIKMDPEHRIGEASLMKRRWFDYRHMHPSEATYFYAECYKLQTRKHFYATVDAATAEESRAFVPDDIFMSRDLTSMWLARRCADSLGIPYPFVMRFAQDRFFDRTQHNFPRPNQLYGEEFELDLSAAWKERLATQITYSTLPIYRASAWKGDLAQAQHIKFVVEQVRARAGSKLGLLVRLLKEDILSLPLIASNFSQQEAKEAEALYAQLN